MSQRLTESEANQVINLDSGDQEILSREERVEQVLQGLEMLRKHLVTTNFEQTYVYVWTVEKCEELFREELALGEDAQHVYRTADSGPPISEDLRLQREREAAARANSTIRRDLLKNPANDN